MAIYTYRFLKILLKYLSNASQKFSRLFLISHSPKPSPIIFQPKHVTETSSPMTLSPLWPLFCFHLNFQTIQYSWLLHLPSSKHSLLFNLPYTQFSFSSLKDLSEGSSSLTQSQNVILMPSCSRLQASDLNPSTLLSSLSLDLSWSHGFKYCRMLQHWSLQSSKLVYPIAYI